MKLKRLTSWWFKTKRKKSDDGNDGNDHRQHRQYRQHRQQTDVKYAKIIPNHGNEDIDNVFLALRERAIEVTKSEPYMTTLLTQSILHPKSTNFNTLISRAIAARLISSCGNNPLMCANEMTEIIEHAMNSTDLEYGHTMSEAVCEDILACLRRDPACETELEVVLFYKGFASLVCHRAARRHYTIGPRTVDGSTHLNQKRRFVSLWLQSQASAAFGVDIHPAAEIGSGVFFDHATGLVIGETAKVGDNCTILHGVTLGGTGKDAGDRHPKVGNDVLIGAGTSILGNIKIGNSAKIGAGSIVLKPIPHGATAVGAPAKVIGWARENRPGSDVDNALKDIVAPVGTAGNSDITSGSGSSSSLSTTDDNTDISLKLTNDAESSMDELKSIVSFEKERKHEKPSMKHDGKSFKRKTPRSSQIGYADNMCIFRMFSCSRPEAISYRDLSIALENDCSEDQIGEVYMELLKNDPSKQHVSKRFASQNLSPIIQKYTNMKECQCEKVRQKLAIKETN